MSEGGSACSHDLQEGEQVLSLVVVNFGTLVDRLDPLSVCGAFFRLQGVNVDYKSHQ